MFYVDCGQQNIVCLKSIINSDSYLHLLKTNTVVFEFHKYHITIDTIHTYHTKLIKMKKQ